MIPAIYRLAFIASCYAIPDWKKIEDISTLKSLTYVKDAKILIGKIHTSYQLDKYSTKYNCQSLLTNTDLQNSYMIPNIEKIEGYAIINRREDSSFMVIENCMNRLVMVNELIRELPSILVFNNSMIVLNTDHDMPSRYINQTVDIIRRYK